MQVEEVRVINGQTVRRTFPDFNILEQVPGCPHFTYKEIANPSCKEKTKLVLCDELYAHMLRLEKFRQIIGCAWIVSSCYRSDSFNAACGGIKDSNHCYPTTATDGHPANKKITKDLFDYYADVWKQICKDDKIVGEIIWYQKSGFFHLGSDIRYSKSFQKLVYNK